eukprot:gene28460-37406_t
MLQFLHWWRPPPPPSPPLKVEYSRVQLATEPVYGQEYVVGNLIETKNLVEAFLTEKKDGPIRKEIVPFLCVVNPPRHGKSLLLDSIFAGDTHILVISITYNTGSSFDSSIEINSVSSAIHFFWLRVMKSLLNSSAPLREMNAEFERGKQLLNSFDDVVEIVSKKFKVNPFAIDSNNKKGVLICVDEFSLVTDAIRIEWSEQTQKAFLSRIHDEKWPFHPFRQFLFTGFNRDMGRLLSHSSHVRTFTLTMCDYTSSRPLLEKIVESYVNAEQGVPAIIFECIKCTPGLVGQWAELIVKERFLPLSIVGFRERVNWLINISSEEPLKENWKLLVEYLTACEKNPNSFGGISDRLITAGIGIGPGLDTTEDLPHFVPLCMALIILFVDGNSLGAREQRLWSLLNSVLYVLNQGNIVQKNGKDFESFVHRALMLRLALRSDDLRVTMRLSEFLPGNCYRGTLEETISEAIVIRREYLFHGISSEQELRLFLLSPIYNLFPVGLATVNSKQSAPSLATHTSLQKWILQNASFEVFPKTLDMKCDLKNATLMKTAQADSSPQLVCLVTKADKCAVSTLQQFYYWLSQLKGPIDTSRERQNRLLDVYLSSSSSSIMNLTADDRRHLVKWWTGMVEKNLQIARCFEFESVDAASFIGTPKACPGHDVTVIWRGVKESGYDDDYECEEGKPPGGVVKVEVDSRVRVHIAAIEVKDRRFTGQQIEWDSKLENLLSLRCAFWWLQLVYRDSFDLKFHVIFAGREHDE